MTRTGTVTAGLTGLAALLVLSACSSSSDSTPASSAAPTPPPTSTSVAPPTTSAPPPSPTTTAPSSTSAAPTTSSAAPTSTAPSAPQFTTTCRSLSVRVLKGGAIRGAEIAAMQFTNTGTTPCTITGTPTATLLRNGSRVGTQSKPNGDTVRTYTVPPGDYAESLLRDFSQCNAPLSDSLRLTLPSRDGSSGRTETQPIALRACTLQVAPAGEPS